MHSSQGLSGMTRRPPSSLSSEPERGSPLIAGLHRTGSEQYVAEPLSPSFAPWVCSDTCLQHDRGDGLIFHLLLTCRNICGTKHPTLAHLSRMELQCSACRCTRYAKTCRQAWCQIGPTSMIALLLASNAIREMLLEAPRCFRRTRATQRGGKAYMLPCAL